MSLDEEYLTPEEAAALLKIAPATLRNWRHLKQGPPFVWLGGKRILYPSSELYAWAERRRSQPPDPLAEAATGGSLPAKDPTVSVVSVTTSEASAEFARSGPIDQGLLFMASANRLYVGRSRRRPLAIWGDKGWRRAADHDRPATWGRVINAMEGEALFPGATYTAIPVAILDSAGRLQGQSLGNLESSPEAQEAFRLLAFLEQQKPDLVEAARRWLRISEAA